MIQTVTEIQSDSVDMLVRVCRGSGTVSWGKPFQSSGFRNKLYKKKRGGGGGGGGDIACCAHFSYSSIHSVYRALCRPNFPKHSVQRVESSSLIKNDFDYYYFNSLCPFIIHRFCTALCSALEQTHYAHLCCMRFWVSDYPFIVRIFNIHGTWKWCTDTVIALFGCCMAGAT